MRLIRWPSKVCDKLYDDAHALAGKNALNQIRRRLDELRRGALSAHTEQAGFIVGPGPAVRTILTRLRQSHVNMSLVGTA